MIRPAWVFLAGFSGAQAKRFLHLWYKRVNHQ
jgi:hypothetical protein